MNGYISEKNHISLNDECTLVEKRWRIDENGIWNEATEEQTTVFCGRLSVSGKEYYDAGQQGLKPEIVLVVHREEYAGQSYVDHGGKRYTIYRHYERSDGLLELYGTEKVVDK